MKSSFFRVAVAVVLLGTSACGALAQQTVPPAPAPSGVALPATAEPAPPAPPPIAPEKLAVARDVVKLSGMARSIEPMVPQLEDQIPLVITRTRPELLKDVNATLIQLQPEFAKKTDEMIDTAARIYAQHMSEEDLKSVVAFFQSTAGKQYVAQQPLMLDELVVNMQAWTQETSKFMMKRLQAEMEKKGIKF